MATKSSPRKPKKAARPKASKPSARRASRPAPRTVKPSSKPVPKVVVQPAQAAAPAVIPQLAAHLQPVPTPQPAPAAQIVLQPASQLAAQPSAPSAPAPSALLSPSEERTWAMLSHLSVLANLVTGFLGPVVALAIYLLFRSRSRYVAYQSLQAFIFQLLWWGGGGALIGLMWGLVGLSSIVLVGLVLVPLACVLTPLLLLLPVGALIYGVIGTIQTSDGKDFKYWLVGDWTRGALTGD